jgi:hypothetical protein
VWVCKTYAFCGHHNVHLKKGKLALELLDTAHKFAAGEISADSYLRITREVLGEHAGAA